jgi:hypothetical protein
MRTRQNKATSADVPRIEALLEEIQLERWVRLDILRMDDMVPRGFKRRPRPKTEIISKAASVAIDVRRALGEMAAEASSPVDSE